MIPNEKLECDLGKILQSTLGLYKKHPDHFIVSQVKLFDPNHIPKIFKL